MATFAKIGQFFRQLGNFFLKHLVALKLPFITFGRPIEVNFLGDLQKKLETFLALDNGKSRRLRF